MQYKFFFITLLFILLTKNCLSVEISLDALINNNKEDSNTIAYLDIEKIFSEHPMTKRFKNEFDIKCSEYKKDIEETEQKITQFEQIILSSITYINKEKEELEKLQRISQNTQVSDSSSSVTTQNIEISTSNLTTSYIDPAIIEAKKRIISDKELEIESMKKDLTKQRDDLALKIKNHKETLALLEEQQTQKVFEDIYLILEKIAKEENLKIIIDKNNVLYGKSSKDITEKVRERLQGR